MTAGRTETRAREARREQDTHKFAQELVRSGLLSDAKDALLSARITDMDIHPRRVAHGFNRTTRFVCPHCHGPSRFNEDEHALCRGMVRCPECGGLYADSSALLAKRLDQIFGRPA